MGECAQEVGYKITSTGTSSTRGIEHVCEARRPNQWPPISLRRSTVLPSDVREAWMTATSRSAFFGRPLPESLPSRSSAKYSSSLRTPHSSSQAMTSSLPSVERTTTFQPSLPTFASSRMYSIPSLPMTVKSNTLFALRGRAKLRSSRP